MKPGTEIEVVLAGQPYTVRRSHKQLRVDGYDVDGYVVRSDRVINISGPLKHHLDLPETAVHEALHVLFPDVIEAKVTKAARDLVRLLDEMDLLD